MKQKKAFYLTNVTKNMFLYVYFLKLSTISQDAFDKIYKVLFFIY